MNTQQLSIVHRLPQSYRWLAGFAGSRVEPIPQNGAQNENSLVALKLLSPDGEKAWPVMHAQPGVKRHRSRLFRAGCEGEPLFVNLQDEFAATCRLKNFGVAIAEPFSGNNLSDRQLSASKAVYSCRGALKTDLHRPVRPPLPDAAPSPGDTAPAPRLNHG